MNRADIQFDGCVVTVRPASLARAPYAGEKGGAVPKGPEGQRDKGSAGNEQLNGRVRSERTQRSGESNYPIDTGSEHASPYMLRRRRNKGCHGAPSMERSICQGMQPRLSQKDDAAGLLPGRADWG